MAHRMEGPLTHRMGGPLTHRMEGHLTGRVMGYQFAGEGHGVPTHMLAGEGHGVPIGRVVMGYLLASQGGPFDTHPETRLTHRMEGRLTHRMGGT